MSTKVFNTRFQLKYDSFNNWFTKNPVLLAGEVAIANVPGEIAVDQTTGKVTQKPSILFKIGDGVNHFNDLEWASGLAADVYSWAKKENAEASDVIVKDTEGKFTGVEAKDKNVEGILAFLKKEIDAMGGDSGSISEQINNGIKALGSASATAGNYVTGVAVENGNLKVTQEKLPTYTLETGTKAGTVKFNGNEVDVAGLGSAAYKNVGDFDLSGTGATEAAKVLGKDGDAATVATVYGAKAAAAAAQKTADDATTAISNLDKKVGAIPEGATATTVTAYAKEVADAATEAANAKVASVSAADNSITIGGSATEPAVGVKLSADSKNALELADDGLKVVIPDAAEYSIAKDSVAAEGYAATYHLTKDGTNIGAAINIPKDMVVSSGSVVELDEDDVEGLAAGTYIKLILANANDEELYIPVGSLIEYVTSGSQTGDMVVIAVDEITHKVTATITDGTITKAKLDADVQASLDSADSAVQTIESGDNNGTIKVDGNEVAVKGLGSAAYKDENAFAASTILDDLDADLQAANVENVSAATDSVNVVTGITQENGKLKEIKATKLAKVASTGSINDLVQEEEDYVIFYCGDATKFVGPDANAIVPEI